jgi:hypothetical protein
MPQAPEGEEHPQARTWLWVITYPVTVNRDNMLILETDGVEYIPIFLDREQAETFLEKIGGQDDHYQVQAMHLFDARKFAREKALDLVTLTGTGQVLGSWDHESPIGEESRLEPAADKPAGPES